MERQINETLFSQSKKFLVVPIQGKHGSGKTYLANLLFNDSMEHSFAFRAWISVNPAYELRDVLESWLCYFDPSTKTLKKLSDKHLKERIVGELKKRRYLIVVDDVSSSDIWKSLKDCLPSNGEDGSRVIVTTSDEKVAKQVDVECWRQPRSMLETEKRSCCGFNNHEGDRNGGRDKIMNLTNLPLGLVVIGGMFKPNISEAARSALSEEAKSDTPKDLSAVLRFCYNKVLEDPNLKECFRYLGQFPPDKAISVEKFRLLWMADHEDINADPTPYLEKLTERKLVVEVESDDDMQVSERFASFKIHRSIQEMCQDKAQEEDALKVLDDKKSKRLLPKKRFGGKSKEEGQSNSTRRLVVYLNESMKANVLPKTEEARLFTSILFYDVTKKNVPTASGSVLRSNLIEYTTKFKSAKVLDFNEVDFRAEGSETRKALEVVDKLKYLSLQGCLLDELPELNCPLLETLDLRVKNDKMKIPNFLAKLTCLKHLYFPQDYTLDKEEKLDLRTLTKLRILENFHPQKCNTGGDLTRFEELQTLTAIIDNDYKEAENILAVGSKLHHVSLVLKNFDTYDETRIQCMKGIFNSDAIHILDVGGVIGIKSFEIGKKFTKMVFRGSEFKEAAWDNIRLHCPPNLKSLVMRDDAFAEKKMKFPRGCFPNLTCLELKCLHVLENLTVKEGALCNLVVLKIVECHNMKKQQARLEDVLMKLNNLQKLILGYQEMDEFQEQVSILNKQRAKKILLLPAINDC